MQGSTTALAIIRKSESPEASKEKAYQVRIRLRWFHVLIGNSLFMLAPWLVLPGETER